MQWSSHAPYTYASTASVQVYVFADRVEAWNEQKVPDPFFVRYCTDAAQ